MLRMAIRKMVTKKIKRIKAISSRGMPLLYHRHIYAKKILKAAPVICGADDLYEVHTLACEQDIIHTLWSLKSFYHFCESRPALVIYDDGTLRQDSLEMISEHFVKCRIIPRERFHHDMEFFLQKHPASLEHSRIQAFYCALKLFGPMYYTQAKRFVYFDSDVLFFQKPYELLKHISSGRACYSSDYQDAYAHPVQFLNNLLSITMAHAVNAGLIHATKKDFSCNLDLVETYFTKVPPLDKTSWAVNRHEQTLCAILLSKADALRLGDEYQISQQPVTDATVSHHFVNDGSRPNFYTVGLQRLKSTGFTKTLTRPS